MQKRRFNFAFDLGNEKHAKAYEILSSYPNRHRSEFVIQSILEYDNCEKLKELICETIHQAIANLNTDNPKGSQQMLELNKTLDDPLSEIPDDALSFLTSL